MMNKVISGIDRLALALGSVSMAGAFGVLPYGPLPMDLDSRINAARDEKLGSSPLADCPDFGTDRASAGWAT
jgi:hypothetical protein